MQTTTPTENLTQSERAFQLLRAEILHGALMPGERLRASELQERYQLGLTPIREALMRLATQGLVEGETHRGTRVTEASRAELTDLMATRREIERVCLTRSIENGDAAWEAGIIASLHLLWRAELPRTPDDREAAVIWESRHRRFHTALVAACGSEWLMRFWNTLADHTERYRKVRLLHHREAYAEVRDVNAEHAAIMEATLSRDITLTTRLMDEHLRATEKSVARLLRLNETTPAETIR